MSENTGVVVNPGDDVYYWINVIKDGSGYLLSDQIWSAPGKNICIYMDSQHIYIFKA